MLPTGPVPAVAACPVSGSIVAQPPVPVPPVPVPGDPDPGVFSRFSASAALISGYAGPLTGAFDGPLPPLSRPSAPIRSPVVQPYVGSPPTFGSAFTTRTEPSTRPASSFAPLSPSAFSTGAAAASAACSLTAFPPPASAGPAVAQLFPRGQSSVPPLPYRVNVQLPGACLGTCSSGPEPSLAAPTFQSVPTSRGVPGTPSAPASRATSAALTVPSARYTGAVFGGAGKVPSAR